MDRDEMLRQLGELLAGLAVPVSLRMPLGKADEPWRALHGTLIGVGWADADRYERELRRFLFVPPPAIERPDGRMYRPRKIAAYPVADADDMTSGIMVLGTHDIGRAQRLADQCAYAWGDGGYVAAEPETGWYREGYEAGRPMWIRDEKRGRAGVWFREVAERPPAIGQSI